MIQRRTQTSLFFFETKTVSPWSTFFGWFCFVTCQSLAKLLVLVCCSLCFQKKSLFIITRQFTFVLFVAKNVVFVACTTACLCLLHNKLLLLVAQLFVFVYCTEGCFLFLHNMLIFSLHDNLILTIAQKFVLFHGTAPPYNTFCIKRLRHKLNTKGHAQNCVPIASAKTHYF